MLRSSTALTSIWVLVIPAQSQLHQVADVLESRVGLRVHLDEAKLKGAFPADRIEVRGVYIVFIYIYIYMIKHVSYATGATVKLRWKE